MSYRDRVMLKPEDSAPHPDPLTMAAGHMALLRANEALGEDLVRIIDAWSDDPIEGWRAAQDRAREISKALSRAVRSGEQAIQAKRAAGHYSHLYSTDDLGVRS